MLRSAFRKPAASWAASLPALALLAACGTPPAVRPQADIEAAWVVVGDNGNGVARVITTAAVCPDLEQDGIAHRMHVRMPAATIAQRTTASAAADSRPSEFPVLSCELALKQDLRSATVGGRTLPLPQAEPKKILVLGDTGCRMKKADNAFQPCNDAVAWPFKQVSDTAAGFKPDLVIHVGDYHYRETPCPDGNAGCAGSPWGYGWDTWRADFFQPAAALLAAAPWVMVRGNHESCSRAGQGWWRFLDPRPVAPGRDCNRDADDRSGDFSAPYVVPVGGDAQLIVFDSAKVPYKPLAASDPAYQIYMEQFRQVNLQAEAAAFNIFISHHPVLGFAPDLKKDGSIKVDPGNATLQAIMQSINAKRLFPAKVQVSLAGHVHLFQAIGFSSDHPAQIVSGNGGSANDRALPQTLAVGVTPYPDAVVSSFSTSQTFGFMTLEREGSQWVMKSVDRDGKLMNTCVLENQKLTCAH